MLAPRESHDESSAIGVFTTALHTVKAAAEQQVNGPVTLGMLSHPQHWNSTSRVSAFNAAKEVDATYGEPWQLRKFFYATASAHSPEYCTSSLTDGSFDEEPLEHILVVNHELDRLDMLLGHVDSMGPFMEGQRTILVNEVRDRTLPGDFTTSMAVSDVVQSPLESNGSWRHSEDFREALLDLVTQHHPSWKSDSSSSDLETVIMAGDISPETAQKTVNHVSAILSVPPKKVVATHSPYRAAMGAACHAYRIAANPPHPVQDHPGPQELINFRKSEL